MRICFLAGPRSLHTYKWVRFFAERGHEVHLIHDSTEVPYQFDKVALHYLKPPETIGGLNVLFFALRVLYRAIALLGFKTKRTVYVVFRDFVFGIQCFLKVKQIKPAILHSHYVSHFGFWAALTQFRPHLVTAWGSDIVRDPKTSKWPNWKVRYTLKKADLITCDAEHMAEAMIHLGAERRKTKQIRFGVDVDLFSPDQHVKDYKKRYHIPSSFQTVISTRHLKPSYDVESFVRAIPQVIQAIAKVKFMIINDGIQRNDLQSLADSLGIASHVIFAGRVLNHELPHYYLSSDVYVSTALSDGGISASTAEAMACGLPVIITDVVDNDRWIENGVNGYLVPAKNPSALADRIVYLLQQDESVRKTIGMNARKTIQERNDYHVEMSRMERMYHQLNSGK